MGPTVVLFLRSDVNWRALSEETYLNQGRTNRSVIPIGPARKRELLQKIQLWNRTFGLSWFDYRQAIKDIAESNHSRIRNVDVVIRNRHESGLLHNLDDVIVIPVDDDDWFAPNIADVLRNWEKEYPTDVFSWSDAVYSPSQKASPEKWKKSAVRCRSLFFRTPRPDGFWTNGYALTARGISKCPAETHEDLLNRHSKVLRTFQESASKFYYNNLPDVLSITHKSIASFTKLLPIQTQDDFLVHHGELSQPTGWLPSIVDWAKPYVSQVDDLNRRLVQSIRPSAERPASRFELPLGNAPDGRSENLTHHEQVFCDKKSGIDVRTSDKSFEGRSKDALTRTEVINGIIRQADYRSYLEIGCGNNRNFEAVVAPAKVGVDPVPGSTVQMTSDEFFSTNQQSFDLIFVDGLHLEEQVLRDVENALRVLNKGGCVLIHDCLPGQEVHQNRQRTTSAWFGDVWKAVVQLRTRTDLDVAVLDACCGMGALFARPNSDRLEQIPVLNWEVYSRDRQRLLRVMNTAEFGKFVLGDRSTSDSFFSHRNLV